MSERTKTIISGTCGGISLVAIGHPFDTIKVKMQTQSSMAGEPVYRGAFDCIRKTVKAEGVGGLYQGIPSPLVGQMFKSACLFTTHDEVRRSIQAKNGGLPLTVPENFFAGAIGGGVVALVESPTELFKSKMQVQTQRAGGATYSSTFDCVRQITRTSGIRGWYQGFGGAVLTYCTANGLFFAIYSWMRAQLDPQGERKPLALFAAGATAGCAFTTLVYPLDTVKSTLMADSTHPRQRQYRGVLDCAQKLFARQGLRAFTMGIMPSLIRATPGCGMLVVTVETVKKLLEGR